MKSNLVRVDFRKNDKSEKAQDNNGFRFNQQKLFEGEVTIFQTKKSGDFWHMRMYITEHQKYFTKSLRTKSKDSAIEKAKIEYAGILVKRQAKITIFSISLHSAIEKYLEHRRRDIETRIITKQRYGCVVSQMNHLKNFLNASHQLTDYDKNSLLNYYSYRVKMGAKNVTIANEQSTINAFCNFCYEEGFHTVMKYRFNKIKREETKDQTRRGMVTIEEYERVYRYLRSYTSVKTIKLENLSDHQAYERHMFRHWCLIASNSMMRTREMFELKWKNVKIFTNKDDVQLAEIIVEDNTSKTKARQFVSRGGEYFARLKSLSKHTKNEDYVFTNLNGIAWSSGNRYRNLDKHWHLLQEALGVTKEWGKENRHVTLYSFRHFGITTRLREGAFLAQLSSDVGTSMKQIQDHYYHSDLEASERNMLKSSHNKLTH